MAAEDVAEDEGENEHHDLQKDSHSGGLLFLPGASPSIRRGNLEEQRLFHCKIPARTNGKSDDFRWWADLSENEKKQTNYNALMAMMTIVTGLFYSEVQALEMKFRTPTVLRFR